MPISWSIQLSGCGCGSWVVACSEKIPSRKDRKSLQSTSPRHLVPLFPHPLLPLSSGLGIRCFVLRRVEPAITTQWIWHQFLAAFWSGTGCERNIWASSSGWWSVFVAALLNQLSPPCLKRLGCSGVRGFSPLLVSRLSFAQAINPG
jgi:hypothetical protein